MTYTGGNAKDGKHYWLTPPELMEQIWHEFGITFDPCPFPKPYDFDGLTAEWGESNYVNPSFGGYIDDNGKKRGPTAWARKAIKEYQKGKKVVLVYPMDGLGLDRAHLAAVVDVNGSLYRGWIGPDRG